MNRFIDYINNHFSTELKLLIFLSQDKINNNQDFNTSGVNWNTFIDLCKKHRLVSHVLKHSTFLANNMPVAYYEKLIEIRLEHSKKSLNYAVHAIRIHQKFAEQKINHLYFKGPLLSLELYKDIGYRNFGDIDILVDKADVEKAKDLIEELDFICIYPKIKLTKRQQKINYSISHHYHFKHPTQDAHIELHWSITNPKSFYGKDSGDILSTSRKLKVSNFDLPYISEVDNLAYLAAHGSIHQFYRLFWLKDFSEILSISDEKEIIKAWELSKKLKLKKCFIQAVALANIIYFSEIPDFAKKSIKNALVMVPIRSIENTDLKQRGIVGKIQNILYRITLKPSLKYYFELIYRLRTHLSDWELLKLPKGFFFLYYFLRPFLLTYQNLKKKS